MNSLILIATLIVSVTCQNPNYARFVNPLQIPIQINSDQFPIIYLNSTGDASDYRVLTGSTNTAIQVTNVLSNGTSLTQNLPLALNANGFTTFVATMSGSSFFFQVFNETFDFTNFAYDGSTAYIRFLDLASGLQYLSLTGDGNPNSNVFFQFIGTNQMTSFKTIDTSFLNVLITPSNSSEVFPVTTSFGPGNAYTVMFFNFGLNFGGKQVFDRTIATASNTPVPNVPPSSPVTSGSLANINNESSSDGTISLAVAEIVLVLSMMASF